MYQKLPSFFFITLLMQFMMPAKAQLQTNKKLFSSLPSSYTGITFRNDIQENNNLYYYTYEYLYIGSGVSTGDINNDGLQDIYFCATTGFNKLYLNTGNMQFKDISETAGISGELGITFTDKAKEYGLDDASYTTQTYFLDYDRDGDMDAFLINHPPTFSSTMVVNAKMENGKMVMIDDTTSQYISHRLYENKDGHFIDISKKAGVISHAYGLSVSITDFNKDGWPDIYVANDFKKPDYLYINNHNGTFSEKLTDYFHHISLSSMGSDVGDFNNDGLEDLFVADMAIEDPVRQKQTGLGLR